MRHSLLTTNARPPLLFAKAGAPWEGTVSSHLFGEGLPRFTAAAGRVASSALLLCDPRNAPQITSSLARPRSARRGERPAPPRFRLSPVWLQSCGQPVQTFLIVLAPAAVPFCAPSRRRRNVASTTDHAVSVNLDPRDSRRSCRGILGLRRHSRQSMPRWKASRRARSWWTGQQILIFTRKISCL